MVTAHPKTITVIACLVVAAFAPQAAHADDVTGSGNQITGSGSAPGQPGSQGSGIWGGVPPGMEAVQVPVEVGPGTYCIKTVVVPVGTVFPPYNGVSKQKQVPCPGAGRTAQPPTPAQLAQQWAQTATLPNPSLTIQPGYAVTGLTAYLEIGTSKWSTGFADPIHHDTISVVCTPVGFDVDWGDGTPADHTSSTGGPYPNGDVTHAYQQATPGLTVVVIEHWACDWADPAGGAGHLTGLQSTGTLPNFEIREIQATN